MSDSGARWSLPSSVVDLGFDFAYSVTSVRAGDGALGHLDHPVAVASAGPVVIMLSVSRSALDSDPESLVRTALEQLLAEAGERDSTAASAISRIRGRLWQLFNEGVFRGAVPKGVALAVSDDGHASIARFGPVAVATVNDQAVTLLHTDDRFPALQRLGVPLEQLLPSQAAIDPLVMAVSSLTRLDPSKQEAALRAEVPASGSILLMSRAIVPLVLPQPGASVETWASAEAGWAHGMSGAVIQVSRRTGSAVWTPLSWLRGPGEIR